MKEQYLFNIAFGKALRRKRIELGLTQKDLAEIINIDDKHLGRIENGTKGTSNFVLYKLDDKANMNIAELFHEVKKEKQKFKKGDTE